jgi:hypothetical protein
MRKLSASAGLGLGRSGTEPLKLGLGGGGKESALKAVVKQLEETLKAKDAELDALKDEVLALNKVSDENARLRGLLQRSEKLRVEQLASFQTKLRAAMDAHRDAVAPLLEETGFALLGRRKRPRLGICVDFKKRRFATRASFDMPMTG